MSAGKEHLDIQQFNIISFYFTSLHSAVKCEIFSLFFQTQCYAKNESTVEPRFMKASHHEQTGSQTNFPEKQVSGDGVSSNEHASRQQRLATSWEYRW
jgi:hypothetical protein